MVDRSAHVPLTFGADAITRWRWRDRVPAHAVLMGLLFGSAVITAFQLLPGEGERVAMLERDGKSNEARAVLEASYNAGVRHQPRLFQLQGLYEASGDIVRGRSVLEELAAQRPRDYAVQRQLSQFYRNIQDEPAHVRSLLALIDLRYTEAACRDAIGILRRRGDFNEEQAALTKCRQKGYRRTDDMIRLASLLAADGDAREAALLLKAADDLRRLKSDRERLQLFDLMIESNQPREAQRRAIRWIKAARNDGLAITFIQAFVALKRHDLGLELARETSVPGDPVFLAIPELMLDQGFTTAAHDLLRGWLDKVTTIDEPLATRFVRAALDAGAVQLALSGARRFGMANVEEPVVVDLVRSLEAQGHYGDVDQIRADRRLGPRTAVRSPPSTPGRLVRRPVASEGVEARPAKLAQWRAELWKRLQRESRSPMAAADKQKALKSVKRARTVQSTTRRFKVRPGEVTVQSPSPF